MTKKEVFQKVALFQSGNVSLGSPALKTPKLLKPVNINFNSKKINVNKPGGSLNLKNTITNG